jgi:RNA polymerase sigma-70 factor (ECF subfamily)
MDPDLILLQQGDIAHFEQLVRQNQSWLRAFLRSRLRDWASADDLAQDVFVTAFQKIRHFRGDSSIETWLRGIATNHLRNHLRKRREDCIGGSEELQNLIDQSNVNDNRDHHLALNALRDCLDQLDAPARTLLGKRYTEGQSVRDIAAESERGYSSLTMQLHRLRQLLSACIRQKLESSHP